VYVNLIFPHCDAIRAVHSPIKVKIAILFLRISLAVASQKPVEKSLNIPDLKMPKVYKTNGFTDTITC
jgi:hypothetical protein